MTVGLTLAFTMFCQQSLFVCLLVVGHKGTKWQLYIASNFESRVNIFILQIQTVRQQQTRAYPIRRGIPNCPSSQILPEDWELWAEDQLATTVSEYIYPPNTNNKGEEKLSKMS